MYSQMARSSSTMRIFTAGSWSSEGCAVIASPFDGEGSPRGGLAVGWEAGRARAPAWVGDGDQGSVVRGIRVDSPQLLHPSLTVQLDRDPLRVKAICWGWLEKG